MGVMEGFRSWRTQRFGYSVMDLEDPRAPQAVHRPTASPLRVLAVTPYPVVPPISGGRLRTFHLVSELLRRGHEVTNWIVTSDDEAPTWPGGAQPATRRFAPRARVGLRRKIEQLLSPYPEGVWASEPPSELALARDFDVAVLFHAHVGRFAAALINRGIPVVYSSENVESELARRLAPMALTRVSGLRFRLDAWKFRRFEASLMRRASLVTAVSDRDAAQLRRLAPDVRVELLPSGADIQGVPFVDHRENRGDVLLFVGTLGYIPNRDGVIWFAKEIMPLVRSLHPSATARLVGSSAPSAMEALHGKGIEFVGLVADVRSELAAADVFVAPLRAGSGTRLKLLEAFAAGIPVVATSIAAEGLEVVDGLHLSIADDEMSFADAISALLNHPERRTAIALAARRLVEDRYDWADIGERFEFMLRDVVDRGGGDGAARGHGAAS
jgi:glycosyltransferase involved in cell wall biosynthesis